MGFSTIRFHGFRNLEDTEIELGNKDVYFVGENGQGKTNFLEALYILSYGTSFRTRHDKDLINWDRTDMALFGHFQSSDDVLGSLGVSIQKGIKTIRLHGKTITDRKILIRQVPTIAFVHDDFAFSDGPPERRRWFMDQTLSLHDPLYVDQLRRYRKILRERNHLLKNRDYRLLEHYSEQLASAGLAVIDRRLQLNQDFGMVFSPLFKDVSGLTEMVELIYRPSWGSARTTGEVMDKLKDKKDLDRASGTTNSGPHRDRFVFYTHQKDFARSASTGQKRLLSLILRVAQAQFFLNKTGRKPLLLLDDVLLELDPVRRRLFRDRLPDAEQIFYTFLPGEETGQKGKDFRTFEVVGGRFNER